MKKIMEELISRLEKWCMEVNIPTHPFESETMIHFEVVKRTANELMEEYENKTNDENIKIKKRRLEAREKNNLYKLLGGKCAYCGNTLRNMSAMQVDHKTPLKLGGADTLDNMYPVCKSCFQTKKDMDIEMFRKYLSDYPDNLKRADVAFSTARKFGLVETHSKIPIVFYYESINDDTKGK